MQAQAPPPPASRWEIGPIIRGRNYSVGMPLSPTPGSAGWSFAFPQPSVEAGHVHYLTYRHGPLTGKRRITMRYRVEAARGVRFVARERPDQAATISFFVQRRGDNWSGKGATGDYRWYAPESAMKAVAPGVHELSVSLDDPNWLQVWGKRASERGPAFAAALTNADRIGFVFGSAAARGHGVFATGAARFSLLDFRVE